jgi:uncharacterized protein
MAINSVNSNKNPHIAVAADSETQDLNSNFLKESGFASKKICIIVFLRAPEIGKVKTRLAKSVKKDHALGLYKCFVADVLSMLKTLEQPIRLYYEPNGAKKQIKAWLGDGFDYLPQCGDDLGRRMAHAFEQSFIEGFDRAVLLGTDLPDLPGEIISEACQQLEKNEAVIGPSRDGGYYLIGFQAKSFFGGAFEAIRWGTPGVYAKTMKCLQRRLGSIHVLPKWRDIDILSDLVAFCDRAHQRRAKMTRNYLKKNMDLMKLLKPNL